MVSTPVLFLAGALAGVPALFAATAALPAGYPGSPYQGKVQAIPGRVFLSDFDQGPKNGTWHDYETKNPWACKVRDSTGVGLQIMGAGGDKGDTPEADSLVKARMGKCYLAETNTGDWTKYTVKVNQAGAYNLSILSAASETQVPFVAVSLLNGMDSAGTGQITLPLTTYFHHWVYTHNLAHLTLDTGMQVLRFDIPGNGPMNIDYIDFAYSGAAALKGPEGPAREGSTGLSVRGMVREAGGRVRIEFTSSGRAPVQVGVFDAFGARLHSETIRPQGGGVSAVSLPEAAISGSFSGTFSGLVFVKLDQGAVSAVFRTFLAGP
ncbi:MAG: hypothetical protein JWO30_2121 [Fibrobacteres bacterium]|nr:hypothetical protein [Fibrobacterota bacterium]